MKMKRYECVLEHKKETRSESIITNSTGFAKGCVVQINTTDWTVKVAIPAETDRLQFGDIVHTVREQEPKKSK